MTLESSDWCVPSSASNIPSMNEAPAEIYCNDPEGSVGWDAPGVVATINSNNEGRKLKKATIENINYEYGPEPELTGSLADKGTPASFTVYSNGADTQIYFLEYQDANTVKTSTDSSWVEGKAYFFPTQRSK